MSPEKIALLINPFPNKHRAQLCAKIISILTKKNIAFDAFTEAWPAAINFYKEAWVIGGDGTLNYFLNRYNNIEIPIVIFKAGTGNDFATRLYGKANVDEQIQRVLNAEPQPVDAADCNGKKFINAVGIGFDGEVLKSVHAIRLVGGHLGYLWVVLKKIFSFREKRYQITCDDNKLSGKYLLVMITNSTSTGGGFMVSPEASINDGKLNMVLCKPLSVLKRLQYLPVVEKGKHLHKDFVKHQQVCNIKIECEHETFAHMDGELISAKTFDITVLPRHYLFKY